MTLTALIEAGAVAATAVPPVRASSGAVLSASVDSSVDWHSLFASLTCPEASTAFRAASQGKPAAPIRQIPAHIFSVREPAAQQPTEMAVVRQPGEKLSPAGPMRVTAHLSSAEPTRSKEHAQVKSSAQNRMTFEKIKIGQLFTGVPAPQQNPTVRVDQVGLAKSISLPVANTGEDEIQAVELAIVGPGQQASAQSRLFEPSKGTGIPVRQEPESPVRSANRIETADAVVHLPSAVLRQSQTGDPASGEAPPLSQSAPGSASVPAVSTHANPHHLPPALPPQPDRASFDRGLSAEAADGAGESPSPSQSAPESASLPTVSTYANPSHLPPALPPQPDPASSDRWLSAEAAEAPLEGTGKSASSQPPFHETSRTSRGIQAAGLKTAQPAPQATTEAQRSSEPNVKSSEPKSNDASSLTKPADPVDRPTTQASRTWPSEITPVSAHPQRTTVGALSPPIPSPISHPSAAAVPSSKPQVQASIPARVIDTFTALEPGDPAPHTTWIHAGAHQAEAGYLDSSLGWIGVRAAMTGTQLHASILTASADAAQTLSPHLAGLTTFISEHHGPSASVSFAASDNTQTGSAFAQANDDGGARQQSQHPTTPTTALLDNATEDQPSHRSKNELSGWASTTPVLRPGSHISVLA